MQLKSTLHNAFLFFLSLRAQEVSQVSQVLRAQPGVQEGTEMRDHQDQQVPVGALGLRFSTYAPDILTCVYAAVIKHYHDNSIIHTRKVT